MLALCKNIGCSVDSGCQSLQFVSRDYLHLNASQFFNQAADVGISFGECVGNSSGASKVERIWKSFKSWITNKDGCEGPDWFQTKECWLERKELWNVPFV